MKHNQSEETREYRVYDLFGFPKHIATYQNKLHAHEAGENIARLTGHKVEVCSGSMTVYRFSGRE